MFSMKYVQGDGVEWLEAGFIRTVAKRNSETKRLVVVGHRPDGSEHAFFQDEEDHDADTHEPRVFIMNELGRTVADYNMGARKIASLAA